jgi:hypothetical protein
MAILLCSGCASQGSGCQFETVAGLAGPGERRPVTIPIEGGRWPLPYVVAPVSGWTGNIAVPSWVPTAGAISGIATVTTTGDLSVDFGAGHVVVFPRVGCS